MQYNLPANGGPIKEANPWKSRRSPKAFVSLSKPKRSTKITDVSPTYAPIVNPKKAE